MYHTEGYTIPTSWPICVKSAKEDVEGALSAYGVEDRIETAKTAVCRDDADSTLLPYGSPFDFRNPVVEMIATDRFRYLRRDLV